MASGYPGMVKGYVKDKNTGVVISGATMEVIGTTGWFTTPDSGVYFLQLTSGKYSVKVTKTGYTDLTDKITVKALVVKTHHFKMVAV